MPPHTTSKNIKKPTKKTVKIKKASAGDRPKTYGQMTRRKQFCDACKHNATDAGQSEFVNIDSINMTNRSPALGAELEAAIALRTPASLIRLSRKFLIRGAEIATSTQVAVAQALVPLAQFSKRRTVTSRCFVAAKASQMALAKCQSIGGIDMQTHTLAEIVIEAVASDRSKFPRRDPLEEFDDTCFDEAVAMGAEFQVSYDDILLACVRMLPQKGKWTQ
jgi:hypothetical protein